MNLGFNCARVDLGYTGGVSTFTFGLLRGLVNSIGTNRIQLYVSQLNAGGFKEFANHPQVDIVVLPFSPIELTLRLKLASWSLGLNSTAIHRFVVGRLFSRWSRTMRHGSDIMYTATTALFPFDTGTPNVLSMHDLQQFTFPYFFSLRERIARRVRYLLSATIATHQQASSKFMKSEFMKHYRFLKDEQITVIPEGVMVEEFSAPPAIDAIGKYSLPQKFLFFPAQLWSHKNHITVLKALVHLREKSNLTIPLVMTGASDSGSGAIFRYIEEQSMTAVTYLGKVPFRDIVALFQQARFFITATLYESSSLPFLEAAAAGCPIIASNTPPNRETSQFLKAKLFEPLDHEDLAEILLAVWDNEDLIREHASHNRQAVGHFHWNNVARRYWDMFNEVVQRQSAAQPSK
jgi:glycosyltransferase involved in cell wall biosynthesis